ncbi:MAG TPA: hypothetical protein VKB65_04800 [Myxococcota bacterium]|nr:hypothetical protein [Myxococcota bacterium]
MEERDALDGGSRDGFPDASVATLARLYREHPAWRSAADRLDPRATSGVWFSHRPGEAWRLVRQGGTTHLLRGRARDPDLVFRFTPAAIDALAETGDGVADFAIRLFELMIDPDESRRVGFRAVASFTRLARRGYVRLLVQDGGPRVFAFAASHRIAGLGALRRLVAGLVQMGPYDWERDAAD